jgi:hypothetical protein
MIRHSCPFCASRISSSEHLAGMTMTCPECKEQIEIPEASRPQEVEGDADRLARSAREEANRAAQARDLDAPEHQSQVWRLRVTWGLFALTLASFLIPGALLSSLLLAFRKGDSVCSAAGCTRDAATWLNYGGRVTRGYCRAHAGSAPSSIYQSRRSLPMSLLAAIGALAFLGLYGYCLKQSVDEARWGSCSGGDSTAAFARFVWCSVGGLVGVNLLAWVVARFMCP